MTPAKKASPPIKSLAEMMQSDNDNDSTVTEDKEPNPVVNNDDDSKDDTNKDSDNNDSNDEEFDRDDENEDDENEETAPGGGVVRIPEKGTDNQAGSEGSNDNDPFGNTNGVTIPQANVINKTPADMSAETPKETQQRYGISDEVPKEVDENPNVMAHAAMGNYQIPSGTHLHPDIARDNYNRAVGTGTERGEVQVARTQMVFATENENDDKGIKQPVPENLAD